MLAVTIEGASAIVGLVGGTLGVIAFGQQWADRRRRRILERALRVRPRHIRRSAPPMPEHLEGYRPVPLGTAEMSVRVFDEPVTWPDFPVTMNGCAQRMWTMRWRSTAKHMFVFKVPYDFSGDIGELRRSLMDPQFGTEGLVVGDGCEQPCFFLVGGSESTLSDVVAEVMHWELAP